MIDRRQLESRVERLCGSRRYDEARREAAMAIELTATGHGDAMMHCGVAWLSARCVVEILGLDQFVEPALLGPAELGPEENRRTRPEGESAHSARRRSANPAPRGGHQPVLDVQIEEILAEEANQFRS